MTPSTSPRRKRNQVNYADVEDDAMGAECGREDYELTLSDDNDYGSEEDEIPLKALKAMKTSATPKKKRKNSTPSPQKKKMQKKSTPKSSSTTKKKKKSTPRKKKPKQYLPPEKTPSKLEFLGDRTMGMTLVHPPRKNHIAVQILQEINAELKDPKVKVAFYNWARGGKPAAVEEDEENESILESCREIQGGRIEIFLEAKNKSSQAFDYIIGRKLRKNAKEIVLEYARRQANQDPRLSDGYKYENFSLLVSLYQRPAQVPHLDLVHPNFQFGLILSDQTSGTLFVENQDEIGRVATVEDLETLWNTNDSFKDDDGEHPPMPANIKSVFEQDEGAKQLLRYFGDCLIPEKTLVDSMIQREKIPTGTLCSLPGSVVHAGPRSTGLRTILFFSGTPEDTSIVDPYLPDSQYNGVTLVGHFLSILWRRDAIDTKERHYLLKRLVQYVEGTHGKEVWALFGDGELKNFVKSILKETYKGSKEKFIQKKARCVEMSYGDDPFSIPDKVIDTDMMKVISVPDLYTTWDGVELPVMVYRMGYKKKIVIRYMTKGEETESPDEYEGHRPEENLSLTWNKEHEGGFFDGTNATLLDTDGEVIEMYVGSRAKEVEEEEEEEEKPKRKRKSKGKSNPAAKSKSVGKRETAPMLYPGGTYFRPMGGKRDIIVPPNLLTEAMICDRTQFCAARLRHHLLEYRDRYGVETKIPCNLAERREALLLALTKWKMQNQSTESKLPSQDISGVVSDESGSTESKLPSQEASGIVSDENESTESKLPSQESCGFVSDQNECTEIKLPSQEASCVVSGPNESTASKMPTQEPSGVVSDRSESTESKLPTQESCDIVSDGSESTDSKVPTHENAGIVSDESDSTDSKLPNKEKPSIVSDESKSMVNKMPTQENSDG